jgi:hypothetical protein
MLRRVVVVRTDVSEYVPPCHQAGGVIELRTLAAISNLRSVLQLPVIANVIPSSLILATLMIEAIRFS